VTSEWEQIYPCCCYSAQHRFRPCQVFVVTPSYSTCRSLSTASQQQCHSVAIELRGACGAAVLRRCSVAVSWRRSSEGEEGSGREGEEGGVGGTVFQDVLLRMSCSAGTCVDVVRRSCEVRRRCVWMSSCEGRVRTPPAAAPRPPADLLLERGGLLPTPRARTRAVPLRASSRRVLPLSRIRVEASQSA